ncbi:MAG: hypothetical protein HYU05_01120 [Candidatus Wildermuthbacteria bacterium]|nr:hypothetical protein [Candidatus Wildermuthbacteria bacterium]MBI2121280.1 hypothetical protein [Candidatus Wildermuthbacteria bacterium]MBI2647794.1 hypothetical protein [Candidatus Wildermuthbacteria bacterium]
MRFEVGIGNDTMLTALRLWGYSPERVDERTGEIGAVRPLAGMRYPRFHVYCKVSEKDRAASVSLHLDHKQPSYEGSSAHGGEYEGPLVEAEAERIKKMASVA